MGEATNDHAPLVAVRAMQKSVRSVLLKKLRTDPKFFQRNTTYVYKIFQTDTTPIGGNGKVWKGRVMAWKDTIKRWTVIFDGVCEYCEEPDDQELDLDVELMKDLVLDFEDAPKALGLKIPHIIVRAEEASWLEDKATMLLLQQHSNHPTIVDASLVTDLSIDAEEISPPIVASPCGSTIASTTPPMSPVLPPESTCNDKEWSDEDNDWMLSIPVHCLRLLMEDPQIRVIPQCTNQRRGKKQSYMAMTDVATKDKYNSNRLPTCTSTSKVAPNFITLTRTDTIQRDSAGDQWYFKAKAICSICVQYGRRLRSKAGRSNSWSNDGKVENVPDGGRNKGCWFELRCMHHHSKSVNHKNCVLLQKAHMEHIRVQRVRGNVGNDSPSIDQDSPTPTSVFTQQQTVVGQQRSSTESIASIHVPRTNRNGSTRTIVSTRNEDSASPHLNRTDGQTAVTLHGRVATQLAAIFKVVVGYTGRYGHPLSSVPNLFSLCHDVRSMDVATNAYHQNKYAGAEIMQFMAKCLDEHVRQEIAQSSWISFSADGSTDRTTTHHLIVYVYYLYRGKLNCAYLDVVDCGGSALHITTAVLKTLGPHLSRKLVGGSCDGASVMLGSTRGGGKNNVRALLQQRFPWLILIHCTAHRQALCSEEAAKVPFVASLCESVQSLATLMSFSYVKRLAFLEWACLTDEKALKHARIHKIRWLSRGQAFENITRALLTNLLMVQDLYMKEKSVQQRRAARQDAAQARSGATVDEDDDCDTTGCEKSKALLKCGEAVLTTNFYLGIGVINAALNKQNRFNKVFQSSNTPATFIKTMLDTIIEELTEEYLNNDDVLTWNTMTKSKDGRLIIDKPLKEVVDTLVFTRDHAKVVVCAETTNTEEVALTLALPRKGTSPTTSKRHALQALKDGVQMYVRQIIHCMNVSFPQEALSFWKHMHNIQVNRISNELEFGIAEVRFFAQHFSGPREVTKHALIDGFMEGDRISVSKPLDGANVEWVVGGRVVQDWPATVLRVDYEDDDEHTTWTELDFVFDTIGDVGGEKMTHMKPGVHYEFTNITKESIPGPIVKEDLLKEWPDFANLVYAMRRSRRWDKDGHSLLAAIIDRSDHNPLMVYPQCITLLELISVFPSNATACEVGFSACNRLKGAYQSAMDRTNLAAKLRVYMAFNHFGYHEQVLTSNTDYTPYCNRYYNELNQKRASSSLYHSQARFMWKASHTQPQDKLPLAMQLATAKAKIIAMTTRNTKLKRLHSDGQVKLQHFEAQAQSLRKRLRVSQENARSTTFQPSMASIFPRVPIVDESAQARSNSVHDETRVDEAKDDEAEDCETEYYEDDDEANVAEDYEDDEANVPTAHEDEAHEEQQDLVQGSNAHNALALDDDEELDHDGEPNNDEDSGPVRHLFNELRDERQQQEAQRRLLESGTTIVEETTHGSF